MLMYYSFTQFQKCAYSAWFVLHSCIWWWWNLTCIKVI